jgi:chemotaxis signal transduction protein
MIEPSEINSIRFRLIGVDSINLAVPEDQILMVVDWTEPTPLPFGPKAVFGVVCVQGRMFTVVNLNRLLRPDTDSQVTARLILALRGDEQLALAVDTADNVIDLPVTRIEATEQSATGPTHAKFVHQGSDWQILNVDELFNALIQGRERRRRRT